MDQSQLAALLETARLAATRAGKLLRDRWREPHTLTQKGFRDWVTDADLASQDLITAVIGQRHPSHGFLPEETSAALPQSGDVMWVIDPIDGTTNFSRRQPNIGISIAAVWQETVQVGVILDPLRDELFSATRDAPARCNEQPIEVSTTRDLIHSVVAFDWAHNPQERQATLDVLQNLGHEVQTLRAIGSAALGLAWVAAGRLDAYWNWHLNAWDFAAGALIIGQAGGRCSHPDGHSLHPLSRASACLASNGILHRPYQDLLRKKPPPSP